MTAEQTFTGVTASVGFARGPTHIGGHAARGQYVRKKSRDAEYGHLVTIIEAAIEETSALMERAEGDAVDMLEFQLAMLGDDTFAEGARTLIEGGMAADQAWCAVLDREIESYEHSEEEYFRARSADLTDIRDRVLRLLRGDEEERIPPGVIYVAEDITPSAFLSRDWSGGGIALEKGSATSHVAMLARQRGVPMIVGIGPSGIKTGTPVLLDAAAGRLTVSPQGDAMARWNAAKERFEAGAAIDRSFASKPAMTADGLAVTVLVNIADPADTDLIDITHVDGVGLMRTEFLYNDGLPDEESQYRAYCAVLEWAKGKPVTIRTVDAGGDKPVEGFTEAESNPFLGVRGIRLCLAKPDIFAIQVRALLRAAVYPNLKVMLPMVSVPEEIEAATALFLRERDRLAAAGTAHGWPEIGIMVEVPAVAIQPQRFGAARFFSIGSNDLTQYVMAASRDSGDLAGLARPDNPAVLDLIGNVARHGASTGQPVSLCGDAASEPLLVPALLAAGVTVLSVAQARIGAVKAAISKVNVGQIGVRA